MGKPAKNEFDPKVFLAKVGAGKTILKFEKNQHVFEQGDVADTVFTFKRAASSSLSYPSSSRDFRTVTFAYEAAGADARSSLRPLGAND